MPHGFPGSVGKLKAAGQALDAISVFLAAVLRGGTAVRKVSTEITVTGYWIPIVTAAIPQAKLHQQPLWMRRSRRRLPCPFRRSMSWACDINTSQSSRTQSVARAMSNTYDQGHGISLHLVPPRMREKDMLKVRENA
jgi:hypothetical protein